MSGLLGNSCPRGVAMREFVHVDRQVLVALHGATIVRRMGKKFLITFVNTWPAFWPWPVTQATLGHELILAEDRLTIAPARNRRQQPVMVLGKHEDVSVTAQRGQIDRGRVGLEPAGRSHPRSQRRPPGLPRGASRRAEMRA